MLDETDFNEEGFVENRAIFGTQKPEHTSYIIQMARGARLRMFGTFMTRIK